MILIEPDINQELTQIWRKYGLSIRNGNYGLRYMLQIGVLGPIGLGTLLHKLPSTTETILSVGSP